MFSNTEQSKQLYIPDFKLWNDYYEKKVNKQVHENTLQSVCSGQSSDNSRVQLKLISSVAETTDQAESIMKTDGKKIKSKKSKSSTKPKLGKKTKSRKQTAVKKPTFTYRKLKDIFSKGKK